MRERRRKFSPEFKGEAVKMVIESSRPIAEVAREIQVNEGTLVGEPLPHRSRRRGTTVVDDRTGPPARTGAGEPRAEDESRAPGKSGELDHFFDR